jgi:transcriptional regulator with XRE-family HTH domain
MTTKGIYRTKILSDAEVEFLTSAIRDCFPQLFDKSIIPSGIDLEALVRFDAVAQRCRMARESRGLTIKEVAANLKVPQYRLKAIEDGHLLELRPAILEKYLGFLSLGRWFARWAKANQVICKRIFNQEAAIRNKYNVPEIWVSLELFCHVNNSSVDSDPSHRIIHFIILYRINLRFAKPPAPAC